LTNSGIFTDTNPVLVGIASQPGSTGPDGLQGIQGFTGPRGFTGPQGFTGAVGVAGPSNGSLARISTQSLGAASTGNQVVYSKWPMGFWTTTSSSPPNVTEGIGISVFHNVTVTGEYNVFCRNNTDVTVNFGILSGNTITTSDAGILSLNATIATVAPSTISSTVIFNIKNTDNVLVNLNSLVTIFVIEA
jgi:hypothetical protein